jgi:CHAD domain-containing protein
MAAPHYDSPARSLRLLWEEMADVTSGPLGGATPSPTDVHRLRVSAKQLRAHLRLVRKSVDADWFKREDMALREAAKRLGASRDDHVAVKTLVALPKALSSPKLWKAVRHAIEAIDKEREQISSNGDHDEFLHADLAIPEVAASLRTRAHEFIDAVDIGTDRESILQGLRQTYKGSRWHLAKWRKTEESECAHRLRRQVKYLAFQVSVLDPCTTNPLDKLAAQLRNLERTLGKFNDINIVEHRLQSLEKNGGLSSKNHRLILKAFHSRQASLRDNALRRSKKLLRPSPNAFLRSFHN